MAGLEVGAGDPWGDEFSAPFDLVGIGGGDDEPLLDNGAGEPWYIGGEVSIQARSVEPLVPIYSQDYSPSRYADGNYSQEGGWVIELYAPGLTFPPGDYRIDLENVDTTQTYPTMKPGCNSARFGLAQVCRPLFGGRVLRFALPAAPTGDYLIKVTFPDATTQYAETGITLVFVPESLHFKHMLKLPYRVLRPKNFIQEP